MSTPLTIAARELHGLNDALAAHLKAAKHEEERLRNEIRKRQEILKLTEAGIDFEKVKLARTVIYAGDYSQGGTDRASCVSDAIKQLSTGMKVGCSGLWYEYFGTKNYDRWNGQRSDHSYGYGPRHGSICFAIGLNHEVRGRDPKVLTDEETEAAIYFLLNLERIQAVEKDAAQSSKAGGS